MLSTPGLSITVIISVWGHSEIYAHWWGVPRHIKKKGLWNGNKTKNGDLRSGHNPKGGEVLRRGAPTIPTPQFSDTYKPNIPTAQYSDTLTIFVLVTMLAFGLGFGYVKISVRVQFRVIKISVVAMVRLWLVLGDRRRD